MIRVEVMMSCSTIRGGLMMSARMHASAASPVHHALMSAHRHLGCKFRRALMGVLAISPPPRQVRQTLADLMAKNPDAQTNAEVQAAYQVGSLILREPT